MEDANTPSQSDSTPASPGPASPRVQPGGQQRVLSPTAAIRTAGNRKVSTPLSAGGRPGGHAASPSPGPPPPGDVTAKDFSFLLRPEIYHALTPLNLPAAFRSSPKQPGPDDTSSSSASELASRGFFRAAAIAAMQELTGSSNSSSSGSIDPQDHERIFDLLYTRLACLTLVDATALAAQEVKSLEDLNNAAVYVDAETGHHLVPWDLRVLNVRLQALGFGDPRRAVMSYYELAREARDHLGKLRRVGTGDDDDDDDDETAVAVALWEGRLYDLGIKVAGALIEMEDLTGAAQHLASLKDNNKSGDGKLALSRALLWLQIGDSNAARTAVKRGSEEAGSAEKVVGALADMADGKFAAALGKWKALQEDVDDEMVGINMAVCLLYEAKIEEARAVLESLVERGFSSHTLLHNLATTYELCTDRNKALKLSLADRIAKMEPSDRGWERSNADFKL